MSHQARRKATMSFSLALLRSNLVPRSVRRSALLTAAKPRAEATLAVMYATIVSTWYYDW